MVGWQTSAAILPGAMDLVNRRIIDIRPRAAWFKLALPASGRKHRICEPEAVTGPIHGVFSYLIRKIMYTTAAVLTCRSCHNSSGPSSRSLVLRRAEHRDVAFTPIDDPDIRAALGLAARAPHALENVADPQCRIHRLPSLLSYEHCASRSCPIPKPWHRCQ